MVQALLGTTTLPLALEQCIATKTDGNPLLVEELTRSRLESGTLRRESEAYRVTQPLETLDIPTTVQGAMDMADSSLRVLPGDLGHPDNCAGGAPGPH